MGVILFFSVLLFSFTSRKRDDCFSPFGRLVRGYTRLLLARGVYGAPTTSFAGNNGTSGFILHAPPSLVRNDDGNRPYALFSSVPINNGSFPGRTTRHLAYSATPFS